DARTSPEVSERDEPQEVGEGKVESEPAVSKEGRNDTKEPSEPVEDTGEGEVSETSDPDSEIEDLVQDIEDIIESVEEPEQEMTEDAEPESVEQTVEHEAQEQDVTDEPEVESEVDEVPEEDESLPESLDEFVERVKELLDEWTEEDDRYEYVQDPLTGEMQRVPKILSEYESDEQKQRRKNRNLFAELSEEERERFKELVCEEERSAKAVERAWGQVVERAEQEREELLEEVREVLEDPEVMQLFEDMVGGEDKRQHTDIDFTEDDDKVEEADTLEEFLTREGSKLKLWIPQVNGERVESVEQLEKLVRERYPGLMKHKDYPKYLRQAKLHFELMQRFQGEELKRGDIARIAKETGYFPTTIKRWVIEGAKPRVYHYLNRNPLENRTERVAKLLSSLNGVTDIETLEQRLRTVFLYEVWRNSKHHAKRFRRARIFFEFLEEYSKGGILKSIAKRLRIGKSTVSEWFSGSQLPFYVRLAVTVPENSPKSGKKWLPLRLNSRTNLPEQFIQVPEAVTSDDDLLSVLQQLQSLRTREMREFEEKYGKQSKALAFMYLLGLIVSDGGFDSDSDLSARVVLYASKKYRWNLRLGRAFLYSMGKVGLNVERRADSTKIRDGKTTVFSVWGSQASPLLRWMKEVLFGLGPSLRKKESPIHADWMLNLSHDYRVAFLQGLADGDGYASIRSFNAGIATLTNHTFLNKLLNTFNIFPTIEKTKVRINRYNDIVKASELTLFKHATERQKQLEELAKLIDSLDSNYGRVPKDEIEIIMEMHNQGMSCGEITESLWINHGLARSRRSVEGIVKRRK
ncbi:MAG: LAGLIDADG family homing endonuclease, partial [Candidatus Thorarchaeota archaeon]